MRKIDVPVLVVGAGGCGLSAAIFLADLGIEALLIERHPMTSPLPKAHYVNQRSMEIFRHHGVADAIYAKSAPRKNMGKIHWCTSLGGDGPADGKILISQDIMGGGDLAALYDLKGVTPPAHIPQIYLEPILRRFAEERNPDRVLFGHELISFRQDAEGVDAIVRDLAAKEDIHVHCRFLLGADAGKTVGPALGIKTGGQSAKVNFVSIHFTADLSRYIHDDVSVMRFFVHPHRVSVSTAHAAGLLAYGPEHWDARCREWGVSWAFRPDDPEKDDPEAILPRIKAVLKIDVPIKVNHVSHWEVESAVADTYRVGRVFIAGDAAHKHPPSGGYGLNSGIQDAHNLCWKLALVLQGKAPLSLLDSYEPERRPIALRNAEIALFGLANHAVMLAALGMSTGAPPQANEAQVVRLLSDTTEGMTRRARVKAASQIQRAEYAGHDLDLGFTYSVGAVVDDGSPQAQRDPIGANYTPTSRPGSRLPHVWLSYRGQPRSTHDLLPIGGFLLLTGSNGLGWCNAAEKIAAQTGVRIHAVRVGEEGADAADPSGRWAQSCGIENDGAILVRPDGHVGFRAARRVGDFQATLAGALRDILSAASLTKA